MIIDVIYEGDIYHIEVDAVPDLEKTATFFWHDTFILFYQKENDIWNLEDADEPAFKAYVESLPEQEVICHWCHEFLPKSEAVLVGCDTGTGLNMYWCELCDENDIKVAF